jgi:pimeloyl-ACP methyl ester carboxylesterase
MPLRVDMLLGLTRMMSYSAATAALLPLTIDEAHAGRYQTLIDQAELVVGGVERSMNFAMHNTVICSEDWPRLDPASGPVGAGTYLGEALMDVLGVICQHWPVGPVDPDFAEPLITDVPVLFISGSADPATPAHFVDEIIAGGVGNSTHIIVQDQGHGVISIGCMPQIAEAFIDTASIEGLDTECVDAALPMPFFLSPAGPAP